jgi:hypothetical protein
MRSSAGVATGWIAGCLLVAGCASVDRSAATAPPSATAPASSAAPASSVLASANLGGCSARLVVAPSASGLVPPDPVGALICTPSNVDNAKGLLRPGVLGATAARLLARLLDAEPSGSTSCGEEPAAAVRFRYASGAAADVQISAVGCAQPTAVAGSASRLIDPSLALFLSDDSTAEGDGGSTLPEVEGLTREAAEALAAGSGFAAMVEGEVVDDAIAPGTVVLQFPPAGAGPNSGTVGLLISEHRAPACTPSRLAVDVHGVQHGTGDDFTDVQVRDESMTACTLVGPVAVQGLDAGGRAVTNAAVYPLAANFVLTADTPASSSDADVTGLTTADLLVAADVRDGPDAGGSCAEHLVTPVNWRITVAGGARVVPNGGNDPSTVFSACQGRLFPPSAIPESPTT